MPLFNENATKLFFNQRKRMTNAAKSGVFWGIRDCKERDPEKEGIKCILIAGESNIVHTQGKKIVNKDIDGRKNCVDCY